MFQVVSGDFRSGSGLLRDFQWAIGAFQKVSERFKGIRRHFKGFKIVA